LNYGTNEKDLKNEKRIEKESVSFSLLLKFVLLSLLCNAIFFSTLDDAQLGMSLYTVSLVGALRANTGMKRVLNTRIRYNTGFSYRY